MSSASGNSSRSAEAKRRARRVPEDQRKRGIQSCDLCRKKRCRCIPASGEANRCTACLAQDVECTFTLPRKTRFYGNVEDLSDRFRCLEAIVKGAFANEATESVADLVQLGRSRGYQMPDLSHSLETSAKVDEALGIPQQLEPLGGGGVSVPHTNQSTRSGTRHNSHASAQPESSHSIDSTTCLVTDTSGKEHYIGPSGGLQFLGQLRRLLISRDQRPGSQGLEPPSVAKFTEDDGAQALEVEDVHEDSLDSGPLDSRLADDASISTTRDQRSPRSTASPESNHTRKTSVGIEEHWRRLPTQDVLDRLLQSFFQNVHDDFVLFHRGTFEGDYEAQTRRFGHSGGQEEEKDLDPGLLACIYMMLVFGSMSEPDIGGPELNHNALRRHCVSSARSLLPHLISKCTLYNLRALLLLSLFLHNNNERNATWNLVGTATRIAFALGLHRRDTESAFNPIEREIRKRVFCTLYGFEQFLATTLGRPSGINDPDVEVTPPRPGMLDDNGGGGDAVLIASSIRLHQILGRSRTGQGIGNTGAAKDSGRPSPESILLELDQWRADISKNQWLNIPPIKTGERLLDDKEPGAIGFDDLRSLLRWQRSSLRASLMLHLLYHYTGLFTTRPFLLQELSINQPPGQEPSHPSSRQASLAGTCLQHASQMAMIILLLNSFGLVNGVSGLDIFYVYWASMILSSGMLRHNVAPEEARVLETFRSLVGQLRVVSMNVERSGTMNRFATLLGDFADYVNYRYMPPLKTLTDEGLENNVVVAGNQVNGVPGNPPLDPTHIPAGVAGAAGAPGAFIGSHTLDSFYWSNDMIPLAQTIEGGVDLDGFSGWAGHVSGVVGDVDWVTTLSGGIDMSMGYGSSPTRPQ
ncbi:fungal-specific transcription factor domain-containing protein [Annulohypoxylon maeteangense]|uniref:fungal-specific transcription factor domain-containing protein n=1 Tax=Annulohypoxylon maeteangense TaxID=1927788 RepID=UPI00200772EA|nr:fungal-specific transcription factor domain-containing protein [Annulohypoxylon maeteangense]KAI0883017.1 fungal-specific transcription factor domain-containing protein [Annulohypoxylon maeteangense]